MTILVLGATGLIGQHLLAALRAAGHTAIGASRREPAGGGAWRELDFAALTSAAAWLPLLDGVDAVVNCVGILREYRAGDFERLHHLAPAALFAACEQAGVKRVLHLSALGSTADAPTAYWRSKAAAEHALARHALDSTIVRPSLVYGAEGASSKLFLALATLPAVLLPAAHSSRVQPVHIDDLCAVMLALLPMPVAPGGGLASASVLAGPTAPYPRELAAVGPRAMSLAEYLACLHTGLSARHALTAFAATAAASAILIDAPSASAPSPGASLAGAPLVLELPMPAAMLAARIASLHPASALTPDSLRMLAASANGCNTADPAPMHALLDGRALRDPVSFAAPAQKPAAVLSWAMPLATTSMAALWLWTAFVSWFVWPHADSITWLTACGIPASLGEAALAGASLLDAAIGCALLLRPRRWLWALQLALVGGYTVAMTLFLPEFWLHPFGPLSKNLPILALLLLMWCLHEERN